MQVFEKDNSGFVNELHPPTPHLPFQLRTARLQLTDELIGDLNVSCQAEETNKDIERIQELLSLPQNSAAAETQDSSS